MFLFPIYSYANPIVLGEEGNYVDTNKPMIVQKNSDGTWSKNTAVSGIPADINHASLYHSICDDQLCIAIGSFEKKDSYKVLPMIFSSQDKGQTWSNITKISGIPLLAQDVNLYDVKCHDKTCMAAGRFTFYFLGYEHQAPFLLISQDKGQSWTTSNAGTVNLMGKKEGQIDNISYSGKNWLAIGSYLHRNHFPSPILDQSKFLMISQDNGLTWTEKNIEGGPALPPSNGLLWGLNCDNNVCIALGFLSKDSKLPFIARSEDSGQNWKMINDISGMPADSDNPSVDKIICSQNFCIANGDNDLGRELLFLISHDQGLSWKNSQNINNLPQDYDHGGISQISCLNEQFCTAVGWWMSKNDKDNFYPMLFVTYDSGETWTYQDSPFITYHNSFNSVQCADGVCDVIGTSGDSPLILTSVNQGQTWTAQTEIGGLPSHSGSELVTFLNGQLGTPKNFFATFMLKYKK